MDMRTVFLCLSSILTLAATAFAGPEFSAVHGSFNFGTVPQGKKVQHTFVIRNTGDALLQIKQLTADCGCTAATPSTSLIPPGTSAEIAVVFDSANFSGKVQKKVNLTTNAVKNPNFTFVMEGTVVEELQATPRQLSLGGVKPGIPREASITVKNNGNVPHKLISVNTTSSSLQITATIKKADIKPGESGRIDLVITPRPDARVLSGYLHIVTDNQQKKEITVPIYGSLAK